jgi:hypothetical protein
MAFIHQGDIRLAEGIFDFFRARYDAGRFDGFNKNWDPMTGQERELDHWEGDNAFLLLALNHYRNVTGSYGRYQEMTDGLARWLAARADRDIIAEGVVDMYAALKPFEQSYPGMGAVLAKLREAFYRTKDYERVLDHTQRAALVFSDISGFAYVDRFKRTETWEYDDSRATALAAFTWDDYANLDISAETLVAWKIWRADLSLDLSDVEAQMSRLWLSEGAEPDTITKGLPFYLTQGNHGWPGSADEAIIDPTCYMLFYEWGFNPMAPGRKGY